MRSLVTKILNLVDQTTQRSLSTPKPSDTTHSPPAGYKLESDFRDYHSGDNYGSIYAHKDGNRVGHLDFSGNKHSVLIHHIGVHPDHAHKGLAMAMISRLTDKDHFKGARLDWGMTTPDGTKLRTAWEKHHPQPPLPISHGSRFSGRSKRSGHYDPEYRQHQRSPYIPYKQAKS